MLYYLTMMREYHRNAGCITDRINSSKLIPDWSLSDLDRADDRVTIPTHMGPACGLQ